MFLRKKMIPCALVIDDPIHSSVVSWGSSLPRWLRRRASSASSSKQVQKIELQIVVISDEKNIFIALMTDSNSDRGIRFLSYDACRIVARKS